MANPDVQIRPATIADLSTIVKFTVDLCVFELEDPSIIEVTKEMLLKDGFQRDQPLFKIIVAENKGSPSIVCGSALYWYSYDIRKGGRMIHLEDLYVRQEDRGKGIGSMLLRSLAKIAHNEDCELIDWACLDWNVKAKEFYHKIGATIDKTEALVQLTSDMIHNCNIVKATRGSS